MATTKQVFSRPRGQLRFATVVSAKKNRKVPNRISGAGSMAHRAVNRSWGVDGAASSRTASLISSAAAVKHVSSLARAEAVEGVSGSCRSSPLARPRLRQRSADRRRRLAAQRSRCVRCHEQHPCVVGPATGSARCSRVAGPRGPVAPASSTRGDNPAPIERPAEAGVLRSQPDVRWPSPCIAQETCSESSRLQLCCPDV